MRPRQRYQLRVLTEPQSEERALQLRHVLSDFIEALVRSEINRIRANPACTQEGELPHRTPPRVAGGTTSK